MKKIVIFSEQSIFSGNVLNGVAEVVDSLAVNLTAIYEVNVVCKKGDTTLAKKMTEFFELEKNVEYARFLQVNYYIIDSDRWQEKAIKIIEEINPDIFHSFDYPQLIYNFNSKPARTVFSFDTIDFLLNNLTSLEEYDAVISFSEEYVQLAMNTLNQQQIKNNIKFHKAKIGVIADFFSPQSGFLLPAPYSIEDLSNKQISKKRVREKYGFSNDWPIYLVLCRIVKQKGIDEVLKLLNNSEKIKANFLIIGEGDSYYEEQLKKINLNNIVFVNKFVSIPQIVPLVAGSDFYLLPSLMESGGIIPMVASLYGTIPIVTLKGGLKDNFNIDNAIIIDNNLFEAFTQSLNIYEDKNKLKEKQKMAMSSPFSWRDRKMEFIRIYEKD